MCEPQNLFDGLGARDLSTARFEFVGIFFVGAPTRTNSRRVVRDSLLEATSKKRQI